MSLYSSANEALSQAVQGIWQNRMRSLLTMLGIIIGVMTVVGMLTLIEGMNRSFTKVIGDLGSNTIYLTKFPAMTFGGNMRQYHRRPDLTEEDAKAIQSSCSAVERVSFFVVGSSPVRRGRYEMPYVTIAGTDENYLQVTNNNLDMGRNMTTIEAQANRHVAVIGADVVDNLFPDTDPLGETIKIGGWSYTVIGVGERKGSAMGESQDNYVGIPYGCARSLMSIDLDEAMIAVQAKSGELLTKATDQVREFLRRRRKLRIEEPDNFEIITQDTVMELYNTMTGAIFAIMISVASISLVVGGIGIMNIMLVSVQERTREIGVRKAVGATQRDIMWQFLIEAASLSCLGGLLGILFGSLIGIVLCSALELPLFIPAWTAFLGFGFSVAVGLFFGLYPASKAARLDPIASLRYE